MSENRRVKRFLLRKGVTKWKEQEYIDNKGNAYDYKFVAKVSSFFNLFLGCCKNGFPVVVPYLWYKAWAFYPFFFARKDLPLVESIGVLNHERIHIRQQRDLHLLISVPLLVTFILLEWFGTFKPFLYICFIPFVPTIVYGIEFIRAYVCMVRKSKSLKQKFSEVRNNTCFEREAVSKSLNADYLFTRKFMNVLSYTGIKMFEKYGQ